MLNTNLDSEVLLVGGGPLGLFTALQLCHLEVSVRIIEEESGNEQPHADIQSSNLPAISPSYDCPGTILLLSPRALQLLQSLNLYDDVVACGVKHWQLQIHTSTPATTVTPPMPIPSSAVSPIATSSALTITESPTLLDTIHSYKLWENKATDLNFCLSIKRSHLCHILEDALIQRYGIKVDYDCELVDIRHGGGLENIVYMENELDSDFYLGNDPLLANAATNITKDNATNAPIMATIKQKGNQHNQERIRICQTHYVVSASGKSSPVRQDFADKSLISSKEGIHECHQKQRIHRQLSVKSANYNKKKTDGVDHYFYSMVAKVTTNFPGLKPVSIVAKPEGTLIILVHDDYASMMIHQNKAVMDDDDEEPMSSIKAQTTIQRLLQPYEINFMEICDFFYWKDPLYHVRPDAPPTRTDTRSIALGTASHDIQPAGWILPDMGFEQAVNLCWKLDLDIRRRCTPQLLNTYYDEARIKEMDATMASDVLLRLLRDPFAITQGGGMAKLLQGHRHCFIGGMLLENNKLNMNCPQTRKVQRGSVGTLAPNGRLKPYNLNQLLTQQTNNYHKASSTTSNGRTDKKSNHLSLTSLSSSEGSITQLQDSNNNGSNKLKFLRGLFTFSNNKKNQQVAVSSMGTTTPSTPSATTGDKWKGIRANHYQLWDQLSLHTGDTNSHRSAFTFLVLCGSLLDNSSLLALRRLKKHLDQPNSFLRMFEYPQYQYSHHLHKQPQLNRSKSTPTNISLNNTNDTITSPSAQFKLRQTAQPRRSESSSSFYSVRSSNSSIEDSDSNDPHHQHHRDSNSTNLQSNRSSLFTRFSSSSSTDRYSMATTISNSSATPNNALSPPLPPLPLSSLVENQHSGSDSSPTKNHQDTATTESSSMFSFVCLTTSSKSECTQFLSEQTPYSLHQLFPFGLAKTFLDHDQQCHQSYAIKDQQQHQPTLVVIRRDGYVGARIAIEDAPLYELNRYFDQILLPVVDFSSAAALVADGYCL